MFQEGAKLQARIQDSIRNFPASKNGVWECGWGRCSSCNNMHKLCHLFISACLIFVTDISHQLSSAAPIKFRNLLPVWKNKTSGTGAAKERALGITQAVASGRCSNGVQKQFPRWWSYSLVSQNVLSSHRMPPFRGRENKWTHSTFGSRRLFVMASFLFQMSSCRARTPSQQCWGNDFTVMDYLKGPSSPPFPLCLPICQDKHSILAQLETHHDSRSWSVFWTLSFLFVF